MYDPAGEFAGRCNTGMVELERVESDAEAAELRGYLTAHEEKTGSAVAAKLLGSWPQALDHFVKVMPTDYKRVLEQQAEEEQAKKAAAALAAAVMDATTAGSAGAA